VEDDKSWKLKSHLEIPGIVFDGVAAPRTRLVDGMG
jgi:hypothetical protein